MAGDRRPDGGAWDGPIFILTHHPEDATPADGVPFLDCGPAEAARIGLAAAGGRNLEVFSPTIGRQLLELALMTRSCSATASVSTTTPAASRSVATGSAAASARRA